MKDLLNFITKAPGAKFTFEYINHLDRFEINIKIYDHDSGKLFMEKLDVTNELVQMSDIDLKEAVLNPMVKKLKGNMREFKNNLKKLPER